MPKVAKKRRSQKTILILGVVTFVVAVSAFALTALRPKQANIFEVNSETQLVYGHATLSGILTKDAPVGQLGTYILVLPDSKAIKLTATGLDSLVGKKVTVMGDLFPAIPIGSMPSMNVSEVAE